MGKRIRRARERSALSQTGLAAVVEVTNQVVNSYEIGRAYPPVPMLVLLASELKVSLNWLLTGEGQGPPPPELTPEENLRLVLTSDPVLVEKIKADLRNQINEETTAYQSGLSADEQRLIDARMGWRVVK